MDIRSASSEFLCSLVKRLIASQFPDWAGLPIRPVERQGNDNWTFRLGEHMSVRLPSADRYVSQVRKEHEWLPRLAAQLPLQIPVPLALGEPGEGYPWSWSIYRWLDGDIASTESVADLPEFATSLGWFLVNLQRADPKGGPLAGQHSFFRGAPLDVYDLETRQAIEMLGDRIDGDRANQVWNAALAADTDAEPVWFHGDVATTNLLTSNGRSSGVIDFGCSGVGDPACDLAIAWTFFAAESRKAFRATVPQDVNAWARGRGWAIWKAVIVLAQQLARSGNIGTTTIWTQNPVTGRSVIDEVIGDYHEWY